MNKLVLALASLALVAPVLAGPAAASHGPPYPFLVIVEKQGPGALPTPMYLSPGCTWTLLNPMDGIAVCYPPEGQWSCGYVWAAVHHDSGSVGLISATGQCTNGPAVTAAAFFGDDVQGPAIGDWDFPFICRVHFDPPAYGLAMCWEGDP